MDLYLAAQILELHHAGLEVHEEGGAELIFRALDFAVFEGGVAGFVAEGFEFAAHDFEHLGDVAGGAGGGDADEAAVCVAVVEGDAGFYPAVLVEHVGVEARVHSFSGPAGAEGTAAAEEGLEGCEGIDVGRRDGEGFEGEVDV